MAPKPPAKDWEIPELEVDVRVISKPRKPVEAPFELELLPVSKAGDASRPKSPNNVVVDDFEDFVAQDSTHLDLAESPRTANAGHEPSSLPWPTLLPLDPAGQFVADEQVQALVPWGEPPIRLFETLAYALWVFRGQRKLAKRIVEQQKAIVTLERLQKEAALDWFEAHRMSLQGDTRLERALAALTTIELSYQSTAAEYNRRRVEGLGQAQLVQGQLTQIAEQLERQRAEGVTQGALRELAFVSLQREQAKRKRLDIDQRSGLIDANSVDAQATLLDSAIAEADARLKSIDAVLSAQNLAEHQTKLELRGQEDKLRALQRRDQAQQDTSQVGMRAVLSAADHAKLTVMQQVLAQRDGGQCDAAVREQLLLLENERVSATQRLAALLRATNAFDRSKVRQGLRLMLLVTALLFVPLLVRVIF